MTLETGNTEVCGDVYSRFTLLYEVEVTVVNVARRSNELSQTHTICNIGVCLSAAETDGVFALHSS